MTKFQNTLGSYKCSHTRASKEFLGLCLGALSLLGLAGCKVEVVAPSQEDSPRARARSPEEIGGLPETPADPETPEVASCNDNSSCPRDLYAPWMPFTWGELFTGVVGHNRGLQSTYFAKAEIRTGTTTSVYHLERIQEIFVNTTTFEIHLRTEVGDKLMPYVMVSGNWTGQRYVVETEEANDSWLTVRNARWLDENTAAIDLCMYNYLTDCHTLTRDVN